MQTNINSDGAETTDRVKKLEERVELLLAAEHLRWRDSLNWTADERARVREISEKLESEFAKDYITTGKKDF